MEKEISRTFIYTKIFVRRWKELNLTEEDLRQMELKIMENPKDSRIAPVMKETGGIRKMRWAPEYRGKSGGVRVCYCDFDAYGVVYCIAVFAKKDQANLSKEEKHILKKLVEEAEHNLQKRGRI